MVYCAGKLIENLKLSYKSNERYFLWVYCVITHLGSRVLPTFRVGYHAGKPIESVVYCLIIDVCGAKTWQGRGMLQTFVK